jgi:RNA polymerase sigma-70 factor (ECF subfamily)
MLPGSRYPRKLFNLEELAILERIQKGDESAFGELVKEHTGKVVGLAWRLVGNGEDAEDLVQESFLRLHRSLPEFRGESRISTWLYRTTTRLSIDYLKRERIKRKVFFFRLDNDPSDPVEVASDPLQNPGREF